MMTTRTAITCPQHGADCVCVFVIEPDGTKVRLPAEYQDWLDRIAGVVVAVEHHDTERSPDLELIGGTVLGPFEEIRRLREDLSAAKAEVNDLRLFATRKKRWKKAWGKANLGREL